MWRAVHRAREAVRLGLAASCRGSPLHGSAVHGSHPSTSGHTTEDLTLLERFTRSQAVSLDIIQPLAIVDPQSSSSSLLRDLSDEQVTSLAAMIAQRGYGALVENLLDQIDADGAGRSQHPDSPLQAFSGTSRRVNILRGLLSGLLRGGRTASYHSDTSSFHLERIVQLLRSEVEMYAHQGDEIALGPRGTIFLPLWVDDITVRNLLHDACTSGLPGLLPLIVDAQLYMRGLADYPTLAESVNLLRYLLRAEVVDYARAQPHPGASTSKTSEQLTLETIADMTNASGLPHISDNLMQQAREEGQQWLIWAEDELEAREKLEGRLDVDENALHAASLEITTRSLILRLLAQQIPSSVGPIEMVERALSEYMHSLASLSGLVVRVEEGNPLKGTIPASIARRNTMLVLNLLVASAPQNPGLLDTFVRQTDENAADPLSAPLASLDSSILARFITAAVEAGRADTALFFLQRVLRSHKRCQAILTSIPSAVLMAMIRRLSNPAGRSQIRHILDILSVDGVFAMPVEMRPKLIIALAKAVMPQEAQALYEESVRLEGLSEASSGTARHSGVAISLVRLFVRHAMQLSKRGASKRSEAASQFAADVYKRYVDDVPADERLHYDITTMAACCVQLGDPDGALQHLRQLIARRTIPDAVDLSVLFSATMQQSLGPDRAIELFLQAVDQSSPVADRLGTPSNPKVSGTGSSLGRSLSGLRPTASLYATLMAFCYKARRPDLASTLYAHASSLGLADELSLRSLNAILANSRQSSTSVSARIAHLVDHEAWKPDPSLLSWIIGCYASGRHPTNVASGTSPPSRHLPSDHWLQAALSIYHASVRSSQQAHVRTAQLLFHKLRAKGHFLARQQASKAREVRGLWVRHIDELFGSLRWARELVSRDATEAEEYIKFSDQVCPNDDPSGNGGTSRSQDTPPGTRTPNKLPLAVLHLAAITYLDVRDLLGAAEVVDLVREQGYQVLVRESVKKGSIGDGDGVDARRRRETFDSQDDQAHLDALGDALWRKSTQDKELRKRFQGTASEAGRGKVWWES